MPVDEVELEVFRAMIVSVLDELEYNLTRTAFSPLIYDYKDYCVGFLAADFRLIAQSRHGLPMFMADLGAPVADAVEQIGVEALAAGDVFLTNYAAVQGQHLNNVIMAAPVFQEGALLGYIAIRAHWTDVGGIAPHSTSWDATEVYQEGVQYRGLRLARAGEIQREVFATILANTRFKDYLEGDIHAQLGACALAQRRWEERVASRWTVAEVSEMWDLQLERSAHAATNVVRTLKDGVVRVSCRLDDSGRAGTDPLTLAMTVTKRGDRIVVDMSEMPPEVNAPINNGANAGGVSLCRLAFKALLLRDYPVDDGLFAPLQVEIPPGTMLSAGEGAPLGWWNNSLAMVGDLFARALGEIAPEVALGAHHGAMNIANFTARKEDGTWWTAGGTLGGGWGGSREQDGFSNLFTNHHGDNLERSAEVMEARYPVHVVSRSLVPGSAGNGRHIGGYGTERTIVVDVDAFLSTVMDHTLDRPWGVNGGEPGRSGSIEVMFPDGRRKTGTKFAMMPVPSGTAVRVKSGGGGGWGDPADRPQAELDADVLAGLVGNEGETHDA